MGLIDASCRRSVSFVVSSICSDDFVRRGGTVGEVSSCCPHLFLSAWIFTSSILDGEEEKGEEKGCCVINFANRETRRRLSAAFVRTSFFFFFFLADRISVSH